MKKLLFQLALIFVGGAVFGALRGWLYTLAGQRTVARLRTDLLNKVLDQETAYFDEHKTGDLVRACVRACGASLCACLKGVGGVAWITRVKNSWDVSRAGTALT